MENGPVDLVVEAVAGVKQTAAVILVHTLLDRREGDAGMLCRGCYSTAQRELTLDTRTHARGCIFWESAPLVHQAEPGVLGGGEAIIPEVIWRKAFLPQSRPLGPPAPTWVFPASSLQTSNISTWASSPSDGMNVSRMNRLGILLRQSSQVPWPLPAVSQ